MKMIMAIIRPERLKTVTDALEKAGFSSLTEVSVRGRGKQGGIHIGTMVYDKLPKELLMIVAKSEDVEKIIGIIMEAGRTGNIGDGKIFVIELAEEYTIRTGKKEY